MKDFLSHSKAARERVEDLDDAEERGRVASLATGAVHSVSSGIRKIPGASAGLQKLRTTTTRTLRRRHHELGQGGLPYPWEWKICRKLGSGLVAPAHSIQGRLHHYLSFQPSFDRKGRFRSLGQREAEELGGVEYRALGVLLWLLPAYILFWLGLTLAIMVPWSYKKEVLDIVQHQQPGGLSPGWYVVTQLKGTLTMLRLRQVGFVFDSLWICKLRTKPFGQKHDTWVNFSELIVTDTDDMLAFQGFYLPLIVIGGVSLAGNTFFPCFLRLTIWTASKITPAHSHLYHSLTFLLHHPRRCFILLFPSINTWYLTIIQSALHLLLWLFWILLQINYRSIESIPPGNRAIFGLFQATGVRTAGLYIISMSQIAPALLVMYTAAMYISGLPIIISIRSTNVYEEQSLGVQEQEKPDDEFESENSYIGVKYPDALAIRHHLTRTHRLTYAINSPRMPAGFSSPSSSSASFNGPASRVHPRASPFTTSSSKRSRHLV